MYKLGRYFKSVCDATIIIKVNEDIWILLNGKCVPL